MFPIFIRLMHTEVKALPRQNWGDVEYLRSYLTRLKNHYNISDSEWHLITKRDVVKFKGSGLFGRYGSLTAALELAFPEVEIQRVTHEWKNIEYVREYLKSVQKHYKITDNEWHKITNKKIINFNGGGLLQRYRSLKVALNVAFPDVEIKPRGWKDLDYVREYLKSLQAHYNIRDDAWHLVTNKQVTNFNGARLLVYYQNLPRALRLAFPGIENINPKLHDWKSADYLRAFLNKFKEHHNIKDNEWYLVTNDQINNFNGKGLITTYKTINAAVRVAFPELGAIARGLHDWKNVSHLREFLQQVQKYYGIRDDEWPLITSKQIRQCGGSGMFKQYKSIQIAVKAAFPKLEYRPRFQNWSDLDYLRDYLTRLQKHYNISDDEWHTLTNKQVIDYYGSGLFKRHSTICSALQTAFPEREFISRKSFWENPETVVSEMKKIEERFFIRKPEDWYRISVALFRQFGGAGLLNARNFLDILQICYPNFKWDEKLLKKKTKKSEQFFLRNVALQLFPGSEVIEDYLHTQSFDSGRPIEIDVFFPQHKIGFEYQGEQHYNDIPYFGPVEMYKQRDEEKLRKCNEHGLHLVMVPYWWERTVEDLRKRVEEVNPELMIKRSTATEEKSTIEK